MRRNGHLPPEAWQVVQDTPLAKNQKLLVKLLDSVQALPDNQTIKRAREFVEFSQKAAAKPLTREEAVEPPSDMAIMYCARIPPSVQFDDGQLRIRDLDLTALLLLQKPRTIQAVIKGNLEFLDGRGSRVEGHRVRPLSVQTQMPTGGVR
ncbi:hypothetical protein [Sorangium sp. So ce204]|uniref:hypothetical protein n=1 Tax=Sorangium sp. So ce204 TaxID=3133288 RepID=UPI003F63848F